MAEARLELVKSNDEMGRPKSQQLIRRTKEGNKLNRTAFLKRFMVYESLLKLRELPQFSADPSLFPAAFRKQVDAATNQERLSVEEFEQVLVGHYRCTGDAGSPLCLFDFTLRFVLLEDLVFRRRDLRPCIVKDYFTDEVQQLLQQERQP